MTKILIVGNGRVASAFLQHLRKRSSAEVAQWSRSCDQSLVEICRNFNPTHVWLAISDDSVFEFAKTHCDSLAKRVVVHFSGGKPSFEIAVGNTLMKVHVAHPLTTFGDIAQKNWDENFEKIPFVIERANRPEQQMQLQDLLPGLRNPTFFLHSNDRPYYHALCALAGGLTVQIWEAVKSRFKDQLSLSPQVLEHFLLQVGENLKLNLATSNSVLTGPLARGDHEMVRSHKTTLENRSEILLARLYGDFESLNRQEYFRYHSQEQEKK
jgi:predicted short-subunit dehydrogenase-like oxidoreductase (DUF2520 family)